MVLGLVAALALAGCAEDPVSVPDEVRGPFVTCDAATTATDGTSSVRLPCFADGAEVSVPPVGKPAVITLWASSCEPCRVELPAFQHLWEKNRDRVVVLGVVTGDTRTAAASLAEDLSVTFPSVYDRGATFQRHLGRSTLPLTLFVDRSGQVVYSHVAGALDDRQLAELVTGKLGVELA